MRPDEQQTGNRTTPLVPERSYLMTGRYYDRRQQDAAANVVRTQINTVYQQQESAPQSRPLTTQEEQWKQYHSAWQEYYQKYYERYYIGQINDAKRELEAKAAEAASNNTPLPVTTVSKELPEDNESSSRQKALHDLKKDLLGKVQHASKKARGSKHFVPIAAALCVMFVFLFLQYNRVLFANVQAYVTPGNIDPQNIIVDPNVEQNVGPEPRLIIPKINVDVPVIYGVGTDNASQMAAMEKGVAHFGIPGANSVPGQVGNTVISGHSSNDILDSGDYKFIFAQLEKLQAGDTIYANYQGKRYTYVVTKMEVVKPTEVSKLVYTTDKPVLTLITCTPLGTAEKRLLVTAEQVSPDPARAAVAPTVDPGASSAPLPGNSPTFIERLFGS